ncbi:unnamed protein product [Microthlaspi erraticum]|uniref:Uncharacterized protein n=1 Tax=Microthlaspi erraticum TaxID=1685480 RepID=A0A6D2HME9_9BRAS|nr:unnamed protein product [Microthlaspi erraticum]
MEISYLDKQERYEIGKECPDIAPQRTGRQGHGLERAIGHQEHSTRPSPCSSIELAVLLLILEVGVAALALVEPGSLEPAVWILCSGDSPGKVLD